MIDLKDRTKELAIHIIKALELEPFNIESSVLCKQVIRCSTSVGANFRAYSRARSKKEAYSKICIVVEEADELVYWLDIMDNLDDRYTKVCSLKNEAEEILKIMNSIKTKCKPE